MQETFEKILIYLHGVWRFRWIALLVAWIIAPVGWLVVASIPDTYESNATVYVDTDSVLKPLLQGIALTEVDISSRLGMMNKVLLSRPNLEKVLQEIDMDVSAASPQEREAVLDNLASNVDFSAGHTHRTIRPKPHNLYKISSRYSDPEIAYKIVNTLLNIFIEDALGDKRQDSLVAQEFLEEQISEYEAKLTAAENRLREFKRENVGVLPEQGVSYYQRIQAAEAQLDDIRLQLREEQNRKNELIRQLANLNANPGEVTGDGVQIVNPIDQRILAMRSKLDELKLKYTEQHPDVLEVESMIEVLEKEKNRQSTKPAGENGDALARNPMYQQLRIALGKVEANIAALKVRRDEYRGRVNGLQQQIDILPKIEAELSALNRDYEIHKQNYDGLISRREASNISIEAEKTGEKVKLQIIEPPNVPIKPISPNRPMFSSVALFFALAVGLGVAFLLSQIKPVIYNQKMLRENYDFPILGAVSMLALSDVIYRRKLQLAAFFVITGLLFAAYVGVVVLNVSGAF